VQAGLNPRDVKIQLAKTIISRFHDNAAAEQAHQSFIERFQKGVIPDDLIVHELEGPLLLTQLLKRLGMTKSTSESIRMIQQGGVKINGHKVEDPQLQLIEPAEYIVQIGKRRIEKVNIVLKKSI